METDKIQDISIAGLKYARFLSQGIDGERLRRERNRYRYIEVYSYTQFSEKDFPLYRIQKTPLIDLTERLEEIFRKFHTLTRRGIRRAEAISELMFRIPDADGSASFAFYKKVKRSDGVSLDIKREFQNCIFFNAYYRNELIASISFYDNGSCLRCKHIASFRKEMGEESKVAAYAARKLVWETCKYGKERGYRTLDLGGINFDDPVKRGIAQFKSSFGGAVRDIYIYRYGTRAFALLKRVLNIFGRNIH